jgi:hypothetical protein
MGRTEVVLMPAELPGPGDLPQGLSWSWEMDFATLLAALGDGPAAGPPGDTAASTLDLGDSADAGDDGSASDDAYFAALEQGSEPLPMGAVAVRVAERLAPGPDLVAWLETAPASDKSDYDLPGGASSWARVAAYAQARQLADIAQIVSRTAQRDPKISVGADGRPARVPASAVAEVSLALTMTTYSAAAWTDLAVDLHWRLPATGQALAAGLIDLQRAKLICETTALLPDPAARAVEERVLPTAGQKTMPMLRDALRRAVIAADPEGARRRQEAAERRAKVSLYPEQEGTAAITARGLSAIHAAAGMARITAMARAMMSAGSGGGIDFLRTQVLTGLLLGTLPLIPPAPGGPPDDEPTTPGDPGPGPSTGPTGPTSSPGGPSEGPSSDPGGPGAGPSDGHSPDPGEEPTGEGDGPSSSSDGPWDGYPDPVDEDAPDDSGDNPTSRSPLTGTYRPDSEYRPDSGYRPGKSPPGTGPPGDDWPGPRDEADWLETGPLPHWPGLPAFIPPGLAAPGAGMSRPVPGLLDVTMPWHTLTGLSPGPGYLGRIGPITAFDARRLADCAARDPATIWRIVITNSTGQALAVTRLTRRASTTGKPPSPGDGIGLVGRITVTIPEDTLDGQLPPLPGPDPPPILQQAIQQATKALVAARVAAQADTEAGGCAHLMASSAYRVPARLRDFITARDVTCRFATCRQPVWCCDIDHTTPYDQGGRTCKCNNGGLCRIHHQIKQLPGWTLHQTSPGIFQWTTPGGRVYTTVPDIYLL